MVLWEITLGTAYFLGLKRTYKLALKLQRRLISPRYPKIRLFAQRRTRDVFDVALKVHHNIQERDIEIGRNLGNWILRWLDKMKPSAQIRGNPPPGSNINTNATKQFSSPSQLNNNRGRFQKFGARSGNQESGRKLFTAARNLTPKLFPTIAMTMRPPGGNVQYRQLRAGGFDPFEGKYGKFGCGDLIRNDIRQWMMNR
ncbi:hypothetical protein F511_20150 [Dorcoceras hygrometricum]|uniref:Uncharacterized protein n=1 Tax=Dorcoceras hygrometricum TaxID=472368 RepID=A0A2Z7A978_9LAMI|nr:hypothetical protein F511_20150 [Dorcoceras hygrometricum]